MRKSSNVKYAKQKKEAVILKYLNEAWYRLKSDINLDKSSICFTDLKLSVDNSYCDVYVDSRNRENVESDVACLNKHTGLFRTYLAKEMSAYKVPTIRFHIDAVVDNVIKINKIFNEINNKNKS